jgi:hypothetical protein
LTEYFEGEPRGD